MCCILIFVLFEFARIMLRDETEVCVCTVQSIKHLTSQGPSVENTLLCTTVYFVCYCHFYACLYTDRAPIKIAPFVCPYVLHSIPPPLFPLCTNVKTFTECVLRVIIEVFNIHSFVYSVDTRALNSRQSE